MNRQKGFVDTRLKPLVGKVTMSTLGQISHQYDDSDEEVTSPVRT